MRHGTLTNLDQIVPVAIGGRQILLILYALVKIAEVFLVNRNLVQGSDCLGCALRCAGIIAGGRLDPALGLLRDRLLVGSFHGDLGLERLVTLLEVICGLLGFVLRSLQLNRFTPQTIPGSELGGRGRRTGLSVDGVASGGGLGITCFVFLLSSLVPVELALNSAEAIRTRANQVSFYVVQFILIKLQLCLGQVDF